MNKMDFVARKNERKQLLDVLSGLFAMGFAKSLNVSKPELVVKTLEEAGIPCRWDDEIQEFVLI